MRKDYGSSRFPFRDRNINYGGISLGKISKVKEGKILKVKNINISGIGEEIINVKGIIEYFPVKADLSIIASNINTLDIPFINKIYPDSEGTFDFKGNAKSDRGVLDFKGT